MQYIIHAVTHDVLAAFDDAVPLPALAPNLIVRQSDLDVEDLRELIYDADLDNVRLKTDEEKLQEAKEAKLEELKAEIQARFSNLPDALADAVKAIKLVLKMVLMLKAKSEGREYDQAALDALEDHMELILAKFEQIYPDDYAIDCVARYTDDLILGLSAYYRAKLAVLAATTVDEVDAVVME